MKSFFQPGQGQEGGNQADGPNYQRAGLQAEIVAAKLESNGDGHDHAPDKIGHGGGHCGPQVGAELLCCNGDENRPVAPGKTKEAADPVEKGRALAALEKIKADARHGQQHEEADGLFSALENLAQKTAGKISEDQAQITKHHGISGRDRSADAQREGELRGKGDQDPDHEPDGDADHNGVEVAAEALPIGEQGQEVPPTDLGLVIHGLKHPRLGHPDSGDEQQQAKHPADDKGRAPVKGGGHQIGQDGPGNAHRGDQHGAVSSDAFVQNLGNQGDARAQFPSQTDAGDEPKRRVGRERGGHAVGQIGQGIEKDRGKHDRQSPLAIPKDTPKNPANQHPCHLHVQKKHTVADQLLA